MVLGSPGAVESSDIGTRKTECVSRKEELAMIREVGLKGKYLKYEEEMFSVRAMMKFSEA